MNLPPDKVRLLRSYDNEKKWELICDQVGGIYKVNEFESVPDEPGLNLIETSQKKIQNYTLVCTLYTSVRLDDQLCNIENFTNAPDPHWP